MKKIMGSLLVASYVAGCASPEVVDERQIGDKNMSCTELQEAYEEADKFEREAKREQGVTGKNVGAALFFWPALLVTYNNVGDAVDAAKDRKDYLTRLADKKGCDF